MTIFNYKKLINDSSPENGWPIFGFENINVYLKTTKTCYENSRKPHAAVAAMSRLAFYS